MSLFTRVSTLAIFAYGLMLSTSFTSLAASFEEGKDYITVTGITEAQTPVLREFFSYNCSYCYKQEPLIESTVKLLGNNVAFERTPVGAARPAWQLSQLAYYVAQKLKMTQQTHGAMFKKIHQQGEQFISPEQVKA
ncbi:MAG: thiol:disulfide interchange protein DsbA/DsbL, partial [Shewanella sp.]